MDDFNVSTYIKKQLPIVGKLVAALKKEGIETSLNDGKLNNIVFMKEDKVIKISHHSFFRYSGMEFFKRENPNDKNAIMMILVTDEMWLFDIIRPIVLTRMEHA